MTSSTIKLVTREAPEDLVTSAAAPPPATKGTCPELPHTLVIVPTYQEAGNITEALRRLRSAVPAADVLVVDDSSPDGTADLACALAEDLGGVFVMSRPGKLGLASAYRDGLVWGLERGYEALVNMDADGSHDPAQLAAIIAPIAAGADLVLGSRYCPGGRIPAWSRTRRWLSIWGNRYATGLLRLQVNDATAGYRAYRAGWLQSFDFSTAETEGYGVHVEMTYRCCRAGAHVVEVPISFADRVEGESKLSGRIILETLRLVTAWGVRDRMTALMHPVPQWPGCGDVALTAPVNASKSSPAPSL